MRAGRYVKQPGGYRAFLPAPLPPDPPIRLDAELARLLSDADRALGRLDGVGSILPNPDLFVAMYVRQEAVLSSQIEGTQSTLEDILEFEVEGRAKAQERPKDVEEVVNYIHAMNHGLRRLTELPLCLRLIREVHAELLKGVRGGKRNRGQFRRIQNWIGPSDCRIQEAEFVPPPPGEMKPALADFERFLHDTATLPTLIHCGLAHAQFETIHPFVDGNGRIGRLLITLLLCQRDVLQRPLLYLSYYFKAHRAQYYDRLTAIRNDDDWEGWLKFFLRGVLVVSQGATDTARDILNMRELHREAIGQRPGAGGNGLRLLDYLFEQPIISIRMAEKHLRCSYVTAANAVEGLQRLQILREITGQPRNRRYRYEPYLAVFDRQTLPSPDAEDNTSPPATMNEDIGK